MVHPGQHPRRCLPVLKSGDPAALAGIDLSADAPVVTVCGMGHASRVAAEQLQVRGYRCCRWRAG